MADRKTTASQRQPQLGEYACNIRDKASYRHKSRMNIRSAQQRLEINNILSEIDNHRLQMVNNPNIRNSQTISEMFLIANAQDYQYKKAHNNHFYRSYDHPNAQDIRIRNRQTTANVIDKCTKSPYAASKQNPFIRNKQELMLLEINKFPSILEMQEVVYIST